MKTQVVSKAYAQSIVELASKENINIAQELTSFTELINSNNDFESLLFSEVFTLDEKKAVLEEVLKRSDLSSLTSNFLKFLLSQKRISLLPLIFKEVIVIDDHRSGFLRGTIEGSDDQVDSEFLKKITSYLESKLGSKTELSYQKVDNVSAGYRVKISDMQLDASLDYQIDRFKEQVLNK